MYPKQSIRSEGSAEIVKKVNEKYMVARICHLASHTFIFERKVHSFLNKHRAGNL